MGIEINPNVRKPDQTEAMIASVLQRLANRHCGGNTRITGELMAKKSGPIEAEFSNLNGGNLACFEVAPALNPYSFHRITRQAFAE
jgi:hypothetical protein